MESQLSLRIGDRAPDFSAVTTCVSQFAFSLWQEQDWVVLFSHPADFTPVSTTEFIEFARRHEDFRNKRIKLLAVSMDSIHVHLAWLDNMKQQMKTTIPFPIVADRDKQVSNQYGMIHPGVSVTFVIDPARIIRAVMYYPMNIGRNIEEIFRLVVALQTSDRFACETPVNWREGENVIVPPPQTIQDVEARQNHPDWEVKDFYLLFQRLSD